MLLDFGGGLATLRQSQCSKHTRPQIRAVSHRVSLLHSIGKSGWNLQIFVCFSQFFSCVSLQSSTNTFILTKEKSPNTIWLLRDCGNSRRLAGVEFGKEKCPFFSSTFWLRISLLTKFTQMWLSQWKTGWVTKTRATLTRPSPSLSPMPSPEQTKDTETECSKIIGNLVSAGCDGDS